MTRRSLLLRPGLMAIALLWSLAVRSQATLLPPNQPEQDACNALPLCGGKFTTPYSYQGIGLVNDFPGTVCEASPAETNSMWMKVTIAVGGTLAFNIIPQDSLDDYDFMVLLVGTGDCGHLSASDVVRCNYNNNEPGSNPGGIVGLSSSDTVTNVPAGAFGMPFVSAINATPGQTYLIMINNFGHDANPGPSSGFTIDFTPSTAVFTGNVPPALDTIVRNCSDSTVTVQLSVPALCSSIAADGSDFSVTPAVPVASATGSNCVLGKGYTSQVVVRFAQVVAPGDFILNVQVGSDGNSLLGLCNDPMPVPSGIPFSVSAQVPANYLKPDTVKCDYSTITLGSWKEFAAYLWSSGQTTPTIGVMNPGVYTLRVVDFNGCVGRDSTTIIDSVCPQYVYFPSAFSPNHDGRNDIFRPIFAGPTTDFKFAIYDRWGRQVFESNDPSAGWDGTVGGRQQPAGAYVWMCVYRLYQQPQRLQKGTVMLIR